MIWSVKPEYLEGPSLDTVLRIVGVHEMNNDWMPLRLDMVETAEAYGFEIRELVPGQLEFRRR